jgi:hypothetical protein
MSMPGYDRDAAARYLFAEAARRHGNGEDPVALYVDLLRATNLLAPGWIGQMLRSGPGGSLLGPAGPDVGE